MSVGDFLFSTGEWARKEK